MITTAPYFESHPFSSGEPRHGSPADHNRTAPRTDKIDAAKVHAVLLQHRGKSEAITGPRICAELGGEPGDARLVRAIIEEHANSQWPGVLCAVPGTGYFFAANRQEIAQYRQYLLCLSTVARAKVNRFDNRMTAEGISLEGIAA